MFQFLKRVSAFDLFSVTFNLSQRPQETSSAYKSVFGGLVSLIICTLGLIFSSNLILKWFQNELIMKISSQEEYYNSSTFSNIFETKKFNSSFTINFSNTDINPFLEDEIYIIPLLINITSMEIQNVWYQYRDTSLYLTLEENLESNQFELVFVKCLGNEAYLSRDQNCASKENQENFFSTLGLELDIFIDTSTINVYTSKITHQETYISMYLQQSIIPEYTILLDYSYYELRQGQFFSQTTNFYLLNTAYLFFTAFCEPGFLEATLPQYYDSTKYQINNIVASAYLSTNVNVKHVIAEYPSISEVLANVGSTFQTMLLIRYLILYFNRYKMIKEFKIFCRDLYFPEIKQITNFKKGKEHFIYHDKKRLDPKKYQQFLRDLDEKLEQKMNFSNLIYEISRMQNVLQDLAQKCCQQKRSALKLKLNEKTQLYEIDNYTQVNDKNFVMDSSIDPFIYSYPAKEKKPVRFENTQFQREILIFHENEEIQLENKNIIYSESMRPQQSF